MLICLYTVHRKWFFTCVSLRTCIVGYAHAGVASDNACKTFGTNLHTCGRMWRLSLKCTLHISFSPHCTTSTHGRKCLYSSLALSHMTLRIITQVYVKKHAGFLGDQPTAPCFRQYHRHSAHSSGGKQYSVPLRGALIGYVYETSQKMH